MLLKVVLVPLLIACASLAGRRFGPQVAGVLIGFPIVSGPILVFLSLEQGPVFGARAAFGCATALSATVAFCLTYRLAARHMNWAVALLVSYAVDVALLFALRHLPENVWVAAAVPVLGINLGRFFIPERIAPENTQIPPRWDLPTRMLAALSLVLLVTALAEHVGSRFSGMLAPLPVATTVLAVFTHRQAGLAAVDQLFRGLFLGLYSLVAFSISFALGLSQGLTVISALGSATLVGIVGHVIIMFLVHRTSLKAPQSAPG